MKGISANLAKILLFVFNGIFFLVGAAAVSTGIFLLIKSSKVMNMLSDISEENFFVILKVAMIFLVVIGVVMLLVGFSGCCGAIMENTSLLIIYIVCLLAIALFYLVLLIVTFVLKGKNLSQLFRKYFTHDYVPVGTGNKTSKVYLKSRTLDLLQISMQCCGIDRFNEYQNVTNDEDPYSTNTIPYSCCKMHREKIATFLKYHKIADLEKVGMQFLVDASGCQRLKTNTFNEDGCVAMIQNILSKPSALLVVFTVIPLIIMVIGVVLSLCLVSAIRESRA